MTREHHPSPFYDVPEEAHFEADAGVAWAEIADDPLVAELPVPDRAEAISQAYELYGVAKEYVAPVIAAFADSLLREAGGRQIVFAARDGLGAYLAANILKEKFAYGTTDPDQLAYAYLTRAIVYGTNQPVLAEHLRQAGVRDLNESILLADIGMYGSILPGVRAVLPQVEPRYLISKASDVPGYADGRDSEMPSVSRVPGNPAVHFLEDTFSGTFPSPGCLVERAGEWVPDTIDASFLPMELLKRTYALRAIEDYAVGLAERPAQPATEVVRKLDAFLADTDAYGQLMVPHAR